jgi:N-acetyl sugar amidotransferase
MDTAVPYIEFDENGVCNYCKFHERLEERFPLTKEGEDKLFEIIENIKKNGKGKKYDCIVGFSGGTDSTYCLYLAKKWGLRPLAVHFDNGWNSLIAVENIKKTTDKLGVDLYTHVADWEKFKDMQIAHLKASVPDAENPTDVAIYSILYRIADKEGVKYVLHGHSFRNEGTAPIGWMYMDGKYVEGVMKKYGNVKDLKSYPNLKFKDLFFYTIIKRIKEVRPLEYVPYYKAEAAKILKKELDWVDYGGHHHESIYTRFNTVYTLREKFNIDLRKLEYSAYIRTGKMERTEALRKLQESPLTEKEIQGDMDYVMKKLGLSKIEFEKIMSTPPKSFMDYPNYFRMIKKLRFFIKIASKLNLIPAILYEKYALDKSK